MGAVTGSSPAGQTTSKTTPCVHRRLRRRPVDRWCCFFFPASETPRLLLSLDLLSAGHSLKRRPSIGEYCRRQEGLPVLSKRQRLLADRLHTYRRHEGRFLLRRAIAKEAPRTGEFFLRPGAMKRIRFTWRRCARPDSPDAGALCPLQIQAGWRAPGRWR